MSSGGCMPNTFIGFCGQGDFRFRTNDQRLLASAPEPRVQVFAMVVVKEGIAVWVNVVYGVVSEMIPDGDSYVATVIVSPPHEVPAITQAIVIMIQPASLELSATEAKGATR